MKVLKYKLKQYRTTPLHCRSSAVSCLHFCKSSDSAQNFVPLRFPGLKAGKVAQGAHAGQEEVSTAFDRHKAFQFVDTGA